jgi:hypothetical protein
MRFLIDECCGPVLANVLKQFDGKVEGRFIVGTTKKIRPRLG